MAIIKCSTCGKNVPNDAALCPNCGNDLDKAILCPKCGSADTDLLLKWGGGIKDRFISVSLAAVFSTIPRLFRNSRRAYAELEYSAKVRYVCNSCGKKFKTQK